MIWSGGDALSLGFLFLRITGCVRDTMCSLSDQISSVFLVMIEDDCSPSLGLCWLLVGSYWIELRK